MPTCNPAYISDVVQLVQQQQPRTVLDIGMGFGKWGHLFREYLDVWNGRVFKHDWQIMIDGVEIFAPYITDLHRYVYDNIYIGNVLDIIDELPQYDLIFMADVIEHISKPDAVMLLDKLRAKSTALVMAVPMTEAWLHQGASNGNEHEAHISAWYPNDFVPYEQEHRYTERANNKDYPINVYLMK